MDRYQQLDHDLLMDPRDYIGDLEEYRDQLLEALAAAEQRATDAETALLDIIEIHRRHPGDTPLRMVDRARTAIVALTAPATQPDDTKD